MRKRLYFLIILLILLALTACVPPAAPAAPQPTLPVTSTPTTTATRQPTAVQEPRAWWQDAVFYEVFVRSFADSNGDGAGDFKGLTEKLDYLNDGNPNSTSDLGVTAIWLMPIHPSPSYHGYDVTDYRTINPDYGSMDDFKHFLSEAHKRGIRVIIDLVINHTSSQNPWFKAALDPKSPYRGWYIFSPTDPGYTGPWKQQVWHPSPGASDFFYGAFSDQMPDLNLKNPAVTAEIQDVVKFWLKDVGVDGFRLDAVPYYIEEGSKQNDTASTHQWLQAFRQFYKSQSPEAVTVGEVMESSFSAIPYAAGQTQLDMVFNFELAERIIQAVYGGAGQSAASGMAYSNQEFAAKKAGYGAFLSNHDQNRVMARFGLDTAKAKSAAVLYLTGPGTPFIYYGEEIGMDGSKPDESIRTPMQWSAQKNGGFTSGTPWEALNANFLQFNAADESTDPQSLLTLYRKLVHLRLQHSALRSGTFLAVTADNPAVYAVLRASSDETILVLCNLGSEAVENVTLKLDQGSLKPGTYRLVPLLGDGTASPLNVNKQGGFDSYQPLGTLPAHASLVLQLQAGK